MIDHRIATHKKKMDQIEEKRKVLKEKDWKNFIRSDDPLQQLFALDHYRDYVSSCGDNVPTTGNSPLSDNILIKRLLALLERPDMSEEAGDIITDIFKEKSNVETLVAANGIPSICRTLEKNLVPPYLANDMLRILEDIANTSDENSRKVMTQGGIDALSTIFRSEIAEIDPMLAQAALKALLPLCRSYDERESLKGFNHIIPTLIPFLFAEEEETLDLTLQCFEELKGKKGVIQIILHKVIAHQLMQLMEKDIPNSIRKRVLSLLERILMTISEQEHYNWVVDVGKVQHLEELLLSESDEEIRRLILRNLAVVASHISCPFDLLENTVEYVGNKNQLRYPEGIQFLHQLTMRDSLTPSEVERMSSKGATNALVEGLKSPDTKTIARESLDRLTSLQPSLKDSLGDLERA